MKTATLIVAAFFAGLAVATIAMPMPEWPARVNTVGGHDTSVMCFSGDQTSIVVAGLRKLGWL